MRPRLILLVTAVLTACAPAPSTLSDLARQQVMDEVQAVTDSLTEAMNAHDADRFEAFFDLGPDFVYVSCTRFQAGGETFAAITRGYHAVAKDEVLDVRLLTTQVVRGDVAVVALQSTSSDSTASGPILTTNVLHKGADGAWRVVYQHQSWPACSAPKAPHPMTTLDEPGLQPGDTLG